ncbi:MAG: response regulator [Desulfobacteraceae bacterium]|jgi:PAS domain S-box-containing protein
MGDGNLTADGPAEKTDCGKNKKSHVSGLQYIVRTLLVGLFLVYLFIMPPSRMVSIVPVLLFIAAYVAIQLYIRQIMEKDGMAWRHIRPSIIADLGFSYMAWIYDPSTPSPLMLFMVIIVVGNGIQYGIRAFNLLSWSIIAIAPFVFLLRSYVLNFNPPELLLFVLCLSVLFYVYKFIFRIEEFREETRKRTLALEVSNNKYRNIFENTGAGLLVIDESMVVAEANPMLEKMTGYGRHEIEGRFRWMDFVEPENRKILKKDHLERLARGEASPNEYEFKLVRKDGEIIHVFSEVNSDAKTGKTIASVIDITPRKKAEYALQKAHDELEKRVEERTAELKEINAQLKKAMEAADASGRAKSEFLANMSHEIRTPMNAIIGMCDLVMNTEMSRKQKEYLSIVRSSSRSLLELINDILDFSKIDAGKLGFENVPFNLRSVIEEVSDMFLERSMTKDIELVVDIDSAAPRKLVSDPLRLRQVLANLTSNAFKFTKKGEISISVKTRSLIEDQVNLLFCVKDTGIGIDSSISDRLFDAFAQADGSTTRKYGGTGLGLAICKKIVMMMGGDIWVESEIGKGSSFYFTIETRTTQGEKEMPQIVPSNLKDKRVLIVDDNPSTLLIIKRFVESFGFRTEMANSAETALQLYYLSQTQEPYGLIIMDVKLKGMDGIEAIGRIKNDSRYKSPPIICTGSYGRDGDVQRARTAGADSFLMKPVKQSILFDTIMEIFGFKAMKSSDDSQGLMTWDEFNDMTVLLVEDNPINQMVATEILISAGITVDKANHGLEAIDALRGKCYDAVLMDVQMPEMDGLEAARYIRDHLKLMDIPIIAMTAHAMYGDRERCLASGMNDYVPKPIDRKELFSVLRSNISRLEEDLTGFGKNRKEKTEKVQGDAFTLAGLDIVEGLRRLGGNWDRYFEIGSDFCHTFQNFFIEFGEFVDKSSFTDARLLAHSMKGAAGNISAVELKTVAGILEQACIKGNKDRIRMLIPAAQDAFIRVKDSLEKMGFKNEARVHVVDPGEKVDPERLFALFKELGESLKESDPVRSESCFNEIKKGFSFGEVNSEFEDLGRILERQVGEYHFDEAGMTLKTLDRKLKKQLGF